MARRWGSSCARRRSPLRSRDNPRLLWMCAAPRGKALEWDVVEDAGRGWRRVVASPLPKEVVELETVKALIQAGVIVVTVGGGGIPVLDDGHGSYLGTAAVIDKDYASSLLAREIQAGLVLIS